MLDINRHRYYLVQILKDIYSDLELANCLGFKGGTALMFFYDLPRFSVDLDFDLLQNDAYDLVYDKLRGIVENYGTVFDEAKKHFGPIIVLDYGVGERKLKLEISTRKFDNRYEIKNLLGFNVRVMLVSDMFAHKLCALLDRTTSTNRDIFDVWFFMQAKTPVNKKLIELRMDVPYEKYIDQCIKHLESKKNKRLLDGLGELMDPGLKPFVRTKLLPETIGLLRFYKKYPIVSE